MKKQLVSLLLLFVFVLGLGTPAAAYEEDSNRAEWTLETIGKYLDSAPAVEVAPAQKDDLISSARATTIRPDVYVKKITVCPIIGIYNNGVAESVEEVTEATRTVEFATRGQVKSLTLTSAQFKAIESTVATAFASDLAHRGKSYEIIAWYVESVIVCSADRPKYLEYTPTSTCVGGTETQRMDLPYTSTQVTLRHIFQIPAGLYNNYYHVGINGAFYFTYTSGSNSGTTGGAMMGAGLTVNSDKTN